MANNDFKNIGNGTIKLKDGDTPVNSLTLLGVNGGISFSSGRDINVVMDRNEPVAYAKSKGKPSEISFEVNYKEWKSRSTANANGSDSSIRDFMLGLFTDAVSVGNGGEFEFAVEITFADTGATGDEAEVVTYDRCKLADSSFSENEDTNKLSFTIMSLDTSPTVARS